MAKRIIYIHGRAQKPAEAEKKRLIYEAIENGFRRVGKSLEGIAFDLVYYGDVNNAIMWGRKQTPQLHPNRHTFMEDWGHQAPFESSLPITQSVQALYQRANHLICHDEYRKWKSQHKDMGAVDDTLDILAPVINLLGIGDNVLNKMLPDLGAYFSYRTIGSKIRARLQDKLIPALKNGDEVCLIAHSMGSLVAYDVLWKLSRMSEYRELWDKKVSLFVTLGSPLGTPDIKKQLYDRDEPSNGMYPTNIKLWHNFSAEDDFICHDEDLRNDFKEMLERGLVGNIVDHKIYNFYVGKGGRGFLNPHKSYGYLDHPHVAGILSAWATSDEEQLALIA